MTRRRPPTVLRGIAGMLTLAGLTAGLPILFLRLGGSPIPARMPSPHNILLVLLHRDNGRIFLGAIRDVSWLAWLAFTLAVAAEAQATVRGRNAPRLHVAGLQGVAGRLVAVASLAFASPAVSVVIASPVQAATTASVTPRPERAIVVRPGDCLWTLAQHYLGAGDRYTEIARLNLGRAMGGGEVFTDPSLIRPGWHLRLPLDATDRAQIPSGLGGRNSHDGHRSSDPRFARPHAGAVGSGRVGDAPAPTGGSGGAGRPAGAGGGSGGVDHPQPARSTRAPGDTSASRHRGLEEATLFTLGMLAGSAVASLERLRHRQRQHRRTGRRIALPTDEASKRVEQKLRAAAPLARVGSLRDMLIDLSESLAERGDPLPPIVGLHLTCDGIEVLLSAPTAGRPPEPFSLAPNRQSMCWIAPFSDPQPDEPGPPPAPGEVGDLLPGLFTAGGTDGGGYLLFDLEALKVTCCTGPDALVDRFLVTAATELAVSRWSGWYDLVLVGCDALNVLGGAERCDGIDEALDLLATRAATIADRIGDDVGQADIRMRRLADPEDDDWGLTLLVSRLPPTPAQLSRLLELADGPGGVAALVAGDRRVAGGTLAPAVVRLAPDPQGLSDMTATMTLAQFGPEHEITVRPQTLTVSEYEALAGIFATASDTADVSAGPVLGDDRSAGPECDDDRGTHPEWDDDRSGSFGLADVRSGSERNDDASGCLEYGDHGGTRRGRWGSGLEVKVLGPVEISGSADLLRPKQAELMLALVLNGQAGLSTSQLSGLLGPDADHPRPGDSVRQLITRTRHRLGVAPDGREYILHLGSGIYVPHPAVTLDWEHFSTLATRGRAAAARDDLRAAMALVRGEPFADCYHWWIDVALVEAIRAEIVDAAEALAMLELEAGDPHAARHAAAAGLAAESAAEQLWRVLMRAEHQAGHPAGVTAAWTGCLDAIGEIAPGAEPHPDTAELYRQLRSPQPAGLR